MNPQTEAQSPTAEFEEDSYKDLYSDAEQAAPPKDEPALVFVSRPPAGDLNTDIIMNMAIPPQFIEAYATRRFREENYQRYTITIPGPLTATGQITAS